MESSRGPERVPSISTPGAGRRADGNSGAASRETVAPPVAGRRPHTIAAHGDERVDDWFWMRDRDDPAVRSYLEAENTYAEATTAHLGELRGRIFDEIRSRVQEDDASLPAPKGPWAYYARTAGELQYRIHCRRPSSLTALPDPFAAPGTDEGEVVLLDENQLAEGHEYFALGGFSVSPDHALLAFASDTTGAEQFTLRFRSADTGEDLADVIPATSYGLAWANDGSILYTLPDATNRPFQVWRHRLGDDPADDTMLFEEPDERYFVAVGRCRSGRYLQIAAQSKTTSDVRLVDADDPTAEMLLVAPRRDGVEYHVDHHSDPSGANGDRLFILTNDTASNFRLVSASLDAPADWTEVIAGSDDVRLESVDAFAGHLVIQERSQALTHLWVYRLVDGTFTEIEMPDPVYTVTIGRNLEFDTDVVRFDYDSLVRPLSTFDYDVVTGERTLRKQQPVLGGFDPDDYTSARLWATAADGTRIPISVVHRKDSPPDGTRPCLLYGYGSYEISIDPTFSIVRLSTLDRGVTFAIAHIRGGGEMGRDWYEQGKLANKPNTFTDFLACADKLIDTGYATAEQLVIRGGSAGGLLMGAVTNLRPDGFAAVVAEVPFVDCLSTMLDPTLPLTVTEYDEWGDPSTDRATYDLMKSYSPYDNVGATAYPAMLVTAGLNDPRVQYWEPAKWVAKLRAETTGDAPIILKTELGAGHAGPSGRYDAWREEAFVLAFVYDRMGLTE